MGVLGVNHIAFRTADAAGLRRFYRDLTGGDELVGEHGPIRVGSTVLAFFRSEGAEARPDDPDELAFDVDGAGFDAVLARAERLGALTRPPGEHTPWSRGFLVRDPDGRRLEFLHEDHGVYWGE